MTKTRNNHYVPIWYQKGFLCENKADLCYLNLTPDTITLPSGDVKYLNAQFAWAPARCFCQTDLYTTFFGKYINDDIERYLFGGIDDAGARALKAFIDTDMGGWCNHFENFFTYIDTQKLRTPKGLDWIKSQYSNLDQAALMVEMQSLRTMHCTIWSEGVREIVSAENSNIKFIISDHPVTIYNRLYPPGSDECEYPNDPSIALIGSQTIFPLDMNHCLILTNLEYAKDPSAEKCGAKRSNPKMRRRSVVHTGRMIRERFLDDREVDEINIIIKKRAKRFVASGKEEWLYPEERVKKEWAELGGVLLPPNNQLHNFDGEIYVGYEDGSTYYQDAYGRTEPESSYLKKDRPKKIGRNDGCGCGSGKKYKNCCEGKQEELRPSWDYLSIRERNLILINGINKILGLDKGKTWLDVKKVFGDEHVKEIYELYSSLWPLDTNIFSLLPKPDGVLRAVYSGDLDPRIFPMFALGSIPFFDEVLMQNPLWIPRGMNPKYSPIENPHQHKYTTLKNIIFLFAMEPFISSGRVNLFPDPSLLDEYLFRDVMNMAESRKDKGVISEKERKVLEGLYKDDFEKMMISHLSSEDDVKRIRELDPDISDQMAEGVLEYMKKAAESDPLILLQGDLLSGGGQLSVGSLSPNYEMSLFMAKATGSIIVTSSETRWNEFRSAGGSEMGETWSELSRYIENHKMIFDFNADLSISRCRFNKLGQFKKLLQSMIFEAQKDAADLERDLMEVFKDDFDKSYGPVAKEEDGSEEGSFKGVMKLFVPKGRISDTNVQRLLLQSEAEQYTSTVPMVIFFEPVSWDSK